ncbi:Rab3 GTPase-activating protein catalytic subunit [Clydaea vesicula]|uniref:Rab3 GTPase-activating protein catalytic subunit n=1 Tax=Clydaea vesicula TaxID=447962 RepID=A0AAD5XVI2_9FUNG|nr:Rab3 GTPase-activating protein catalytic subunit [Clydaea vesicula]
MEEEYFEIVDYTSASPWEIFIKQIQELMENVVPLKEQNKLFLEYKDKQYFITYYVESSHKLHLLTGLKHFLLLEQFDLLNDENVNKKNVFFDVNTSKLISSAVQIAMLNINLEIPFFTPVGLDGWYSGFLNLKEYSFLYQIRNGILKNKSNLENFWLSNFYNKLEQRERGSSNYPAKLKVSHIYCLDVPGNTPLPMHFTSNSLFAPFIPHGPLHELILYIDLTATFNNITVNKNDDLSGRFPPSEADSLTLYVELDVTGSDGNRSKVKTSGKRDFGGRMMTLSSTIYHVTDTWKAAEREEIKFPPSVVEKKEEVMLPHKSLAKKASVMFGSRDNAISTACTIDPSDINETIFYLFQTKIQPIPCQLNTKDLAKCFPNQTLVPKDSFLWHFCLKLLDAGSPTTFLRTKDANLLSFFKAIWFETCNQFRTGWESGYFLPRIGVKNFSRKVFDEEFNESLDEFFFDYLKELSSGRSNKTNIKTSENDNFAIDLKYNLLHQKLQMLQLCTLHKWKSGGYGNFERHEQMVEQQKAFENKVLKGVTEVNDGERSLNSLIKEKVLKSKASVSFLSKKLFGLNNAKGDSAEILESDSDKPESPGTSPESFGNIEITDYIPNSINSNQAQPQIIEAKSNATRIHWKEDAVAKDGFTSNFSSLDSEQSYAVLVPNRMNKNKSELATSWASDKSWDFANKGKNTPEILMNNSLTINSNFNSISEEENLFFVGGDFEENFLNNGNADNDKVSLDGNQELFPPLSTIVAEEIAGRKCLFGNEKLLGYEDREFWIPETQESGYMTTDMIKEQQTIFEKLGTSSLAAKQRAKMQSAHLKSDMEAFKAANPGSCIEDFVRWHSPRDFQFDDDGKGYLSDRMKDPKNLWQEFWRKTKPIPISKQKSLFDFEKEAEKVLNYLEHLSPFIILHQLLPTLFLCAFETLSSHPVVPNLPSLQDEIFVLMSCLKDVKWDDLKYTSISDETSEHNPELEKIIKKIRDIEVKLGLAISLLQKFPEEFELINEVLNFREYKIINTDAHKKAKETVLEFFLEKDKKRTQSEQKLKSMVNVVEMKLKFKEDIVELKEEMLGDMEGYGGNTLLVDIDFLEKKYDISEAAVQFNI